MTKTTDLRPGDLWMSRDPRDKGRVIRLMHRYEADRWRVENADTLRRSTIRGTTLIAKYEFYSRG